MNWRAFRTVFLYIGILLLAAPAHAEEQPPELLPTLEAATPPPEASSASTTQRAAASEEEPELVWGCALVFQNGSDVETERCGMGYYRTLCSISAGEEVCETFFEFVEEQEEPETDPFEEDLAYLFERRNLILSSSWNGVPLEAGPVSPGPGTLTWSYEIQEPEDFFLSGSPGTSFQEALDVAMLTLQVYKGEPGAATLIYSETLGRETLGSSEFIVPESGEYFVTIAATYPDGTLPGWVCTGGDICPRFVTLLSSFTWYMQYGQSYFDEVEDERDQAQHFVFEEEPANHFWFRMPVTFGLSAFAVDETQEQASNVLFLPGIKGSRLYAGDGSKLWEPFGNQDVEALMLSAQGESLRSDIHTKTGDIIDRVALATDIYGSYMDFMDGLVKEDVINAWRAVPYDWRLSLEDIVEGGSEEEGRISYIGPSEDPYIQRTLEELALTSKSGKVTIVAHSNGGLVAKELMLRLGDEETQRLIDKVVFVGVPQSGAPQALNALLYGYEEGLPNWLPVIVSTPTARTFAENAPMGYHLLPSQQYFDSVYDEEHPVVRFEEGEAYHIERAAYGDSIDSYEELRLFALAAEGGREKPQASDTHQANILNARLLEYAREKHEQLDAWRPPSGVEVHQIAGWGRSTVAGIRYYEKCVLFVCASLQDPIFVEDGDKVVPVPSALMLPESGNTKRYWLNLRNYRFGFVETKDHGNLLSIEEIQSLVNKILVSELDSLPATIRDQQPSGTPTEKRLLFLLHSPLALQIEDSNGNRVGLGKDGLIKEEIPEAEYGISGGVQYIFAPADTEYELTLQGYGFGEFTLEIRETEGEEINSEITFLEIPASESTEVNMHIESDLELVHSLQIDMDGDGEIETQVNARAGDVATYEETTVEETNERSYVRNQLRANSFSTTSSLEDLQLKLYKALLEILLQYLKVNEQKIYTYEI